MRLADLEDSAHVPPGTDIIGRQMGNWMWRSPEAHAEGPVNKPSDLFSFGLVVSISPHYSLAYLWWPMILLQNRSHHSADSEALQCFYAVHKRILFHVAEQELEEGEEVLAHVLERQISYFATEESLAAFLEYLGTSPWVEIFAVVRDGFNAENPRRPIALWEGVDPDLKDLLAGLTDFDPNKRLTAREALDHPWFKGI